MNEAFLLDRLPDLWADANDCNRHLRWMEAEVPPPGKIGKRADLTIIRRAKTCCAACDRLLAPGFKLHERSPWCGRKMCAERLDRWSGAMKAVRAGRAW
ncbi:hypothetical protein [Primorskyibacter sp. S87]|uniref:hypothetical protein n=1 Tax=Primorskyibacter sp. S87 TaxID=3415126 RepID=UPI003C7BD27D